MRRWHFEDMLQKECIQFGDLPKYHQLWYGHKPHVRRFWIQPTHCWPTDWRELQHGPFNFSRCRRDVTAWGIQSNQVKLITAIWWSASRCHLPYACPLVLSHFEYFANFQTAPYAQAITNNNVQDQRVPPAFNEIRQQMREGYLGNFPHNANQPKNANVSNEHGLQREQSISPFNTHSANYAACKISQRIP